jgi:hypothetical protein
MILHSVHWSILNFANEEEEEDNDDNNTIGHCTHTSESANVKAQ